MTIFGALHFHGAILYTYYKATKYIFKNSREIVYAIQHGMETGAKLNKELDQVKYNRSQYETVKFEELD